MKITCVADTHRSHNDLKLDRGDILIFAGDIDCWGNNAKLVLKDFSYWLKIQPFKYKIIIGGNHDELLEKLGYNIIKNDYFKEQDNIFYLENNNCIIEGIKFWGSPITPAFNNWFFSANRGNEIAKIWKKIPKDTDVIITHGPPYGVLDETLRGEKVGCYDLGLAVIKIEPRYHIFGHIHLEGGKAVFQNGTTFINCSVLDEDYDLVNEPIIFNYE